MGLLRVVYVLAVITAGAVLMADGGVLIVFLAILGLFLMEGAGVFGTDGRGR